VNSAHLQQQQLAEGASYAEAFAHLYLGALSITNEGADWVITAGELANGDIEPLHAVIAMLPVVSASTIKILNASGDVVKVIPADEVAKIKAGGYAEAAAQSARKSRLARLFGHNEYKVVDATKFAKAKKGLLEFYKKHGGPGIVYVDDAVLRGRNGALDTMDGTIHISKTLRDKYPHLVEGTILEELQHFHQLKSRGWFGRTLTQAEHDLLEYEVIQRLLRSGLEIFGLAD